MILKKLFKITVFVLILAQFTNIFKSQGFNFYLFDLIVIAFDAYGFYYFLSKEKIFKLPFWSILTIVFVIFSTGTLILALNQFKISEIAVSAMYLFRYVAYVAVSVIVFNMLKTKILSIRELFDILINSGSHTCNSRVYTVNYIT